MGTLNPFIEHPGEHNSINGGEQYLFSFANGHGASVVRHNFSYGHEHDLWEVAALTATGEIDYGGPIGDDVIGWLNEQAVRDLLTQIATLV